MVAPTMSRRSRILTNLQRQLQSITCENGYSTTVQDVTLDVQNWDQSTEAQCPIIYIVDENAPYKYNPGKLLQIDWIVNLYGVMKGKTQFEMEEFISDIEVCISKNLSLAFPDSVLPGDPNYPLGLAVGYTEIQNIITDGQFFSKVDGSQLFKVTLKLTYTKCRGER